MLEFRPHHFLCTLGFEGKGYSPEFIRNFQEIADRLRKSPLGDGEKILVTRAADSICAPCPSRRGESCASADKIERLDSAHARVLGIAGGEVLRWSDAKARIAARFTNDEFERACAPCSWKALGVCKSALLRLRNAAQESVTKSAGKSVKTGLALLLGVSLAAHSAVSGPVPADTLLQNLYKNHKSKHAAELKHAYDSFQAGRYDQAIHEASRLLGDANLSDYARWLTAISLRAQADSALENQRYKDATKLATKAVSYLVGIEESSPYSPFVRSFPKDIALAEIALGRADDGAKNFKLAAQHFENAFQRIAAKENSASGLAELRPEALEAYSEICSSSKSPSDLCEPWLVRLCTLYPRNSVELRAIAKHFEDADEHVRTPYYPRSTQSYKAPDLDQVSFDDAMGKYLDEKYDDSIKLFRAFLDEFPRSTYRFRARYWLGQALNHNQKHEDAQKIYEDLLRDSPLTYYGLLAALAAGKPPDSAIDGSLPLAQERDPFLSPEELIRIQRAEWLVTAGANDLAAIELREFKPRPQLTSEFLMYVCMLNSQVKNYSTSFVFLSELIQRGYPGVSSSYGLRMIFPLQYIDEIRAAAQANNIDPILVLSLVKQESAFDAKAISGSGALGLMQLMPVTAIETEQDVVRAELGDAKVNIRVGTAYLKRLLNRFNGNIVLALAGYNAGPGAADRWLKESPPKRGILEFIEAIPYKETREYVSSIIRNYYWYSKKLNGEPPKSMTYFWNMYGPAEPPAGIADVSATQK